MTNEVKNAVNVIKEYLALDKDIEGNEYIDSLRVMVQALESQEDVLGKVRAEIFKEVINYSGTGEEVIQAYADGLKKGLDIIDKYRTGSEDKV